LRTMLSRKAIPEPGAAAAFTKRADVRSRSTEVFSSLSSPPLHYL
jgi:hypothetical protein